MDLICPKCQAPMRQYERSSVVVDQCTQCRGIFLDRGELERLVDAENAWHGGGAPVYEDRPRHDPRYEERPRYDDYSTQGYPSHGYGHSKRRKKSFLDELFD